MTTVQSLLSDLGDNFADFNLSEIQEVLQCLAQEQAFDVSHAEKLTQKALRGADVASEFLSKMVEVIGKLEAEVNSTKNKVALQYKSPDNVRITADQRKAAAECSTEVTEIQMKLASAKGYKVLLEKKYDNLIRAHYAFKDIANKHRQNGGIGYGSSNRKLEEKNEWENF